ncbi:MAG: TetR/AcrR family transcriptional regulator [Promethearchaeota archaeon]
MSSRKFSRNKQEKIDRIYDTFFKLIVKRGYSKTSTNHVAESANLSIGTIYKYFPKGKEDIIRKYFEESMQTFLDSHNLNNMKDENVREFLHHFVLDLFKNHKDNEGYNLAFRSAIQSDKKLLNVYKTKVINFFKDTIQIVRKTNEDLKKFNENQLVDVFVFMYNLVNALIYHHLAVMELFDTDDKFIDYVSNLVIFSLTYYLKKDSMKML